MIPSSTVDIETDSMLPESIEALRQCWSAHPGYMNFGTFGPSTRTVLATEQRVREAMNQDFSRFFEEHLQAQYVRERLARVAGFLDAGVEDIVWLSGTTEAMNVAAQGLVLPPGSEVVTHNYEHPAGVYPWLYRAQRDEVSVRQLDYPQDCDSPEEILEFFADAIGPATRVLSFSHVNYADGAVLPVAAICRLAEERGVITVVDGAQAPGMLRVSVRELGCDIYATSLHKWTAGIYGSGALYVHPRIQDKLKPLMVETFHGFSALTRFGLRSAPAGLDFRRDWPRAMRRFSGLFIYAGPLLAGTLAAIEEFDAVGLPVVENEVKRLGDRLRGGLRAIAGITLHTPAAMAAGITSFEVAGLIPGEVTRRLRDDINVVGRVIDHSPIGFQAVRLCSHVFNTDETVDRVIELIARLSEENGGK